MKKALIGLVALFLLGLLIQKISADSISVSCSAVGEDRFVLNINIDPPRQIVVTVVYKDGTTTTLAPETVGAFEFGDFNVASFTFEGEGVSGGGSCLNATPVPTETPAPTETPSPTATNTPRPTRTPTPEGWPTATPRPTRTDTPSPEPPAVPTETRIATPTAVIGIQAGCGFETTTSIYTLWYQAVPPDGVMASTVVVELANGVQLSESPNSPSWSGEFTDQVINFSVMITWVTGESSSSDWGCHLALPTPTPTPSPTPTASPTTPPPPPPTEEEDDDDDEAPLPPPSSTPLPTATPAHLPAQAPPPTVAPVVVFLPDTGNGPPPTPTLPAITPEKMGETVTGFINLLLLATCGGLLILAAWGVTRLF